MRNLFVFQIYPFLKLLILILTYPIWMPFSAYKRRRFLQFSRLSWNDLPVIPLDVLIPHDMSDDMCVSLKALHTEEHNCSVFELFVLGIAAKSVSAQNAYEIGTYDGRSALSIACNIKKGGTVHTLNLPEGYFDKNPEQQNRVDIQLSKKVTSGYRFLRQPERETIVQHWGNSLQYSAQQNAPYDLIFIDGGHGYNEVSHDSGEALRFINRQNGIILWHDATSFGVGQWLPQLRKEFSHIYRVEGTNIALLRFKNGNTVEYPNPL